MPTDDTAPESPAADVAARIIRRSFELDGAEFSWWAVDDSPAFVTVSSKWFGSKSAFSMRDPEETARILAARIVERYKAQADRMRCERESTDEHHETEPRVANAIVS